MHRRNLGVRNYSKWNDVYARTVAHPTNIVQFRVGTFEYICDLNSQSELVGEVSFDQTIKDRVAFCTALSCPNNKSARLAKSRCIMMPVPEWQGSATGKWLECIGALPPDMRTGLGKHSSKITNWTKAKNGSDSGSFLIQIVALQ
jgi:hypothetical protein